MRLRKQELGDRNLVGSRVEAVRKQKGMKQKELLAQLQVNGVDMNASGLSKLEGQIRFVTDVELVALADILEVSVDYLLGRENWFLTESLNCTVDFSAVLLLADKTVDIKRITAAVIGEMNVIDLNNIEKYRENNRIEAKKATGGLPKSLWETYSSFANTLGGIILLGVEEYRDKSLHPVNLPDPDELIEEFWEIANDIQKVSTNILSYDDVYVQKIEEKHIIVITVPKAKRFDRPVYLDGSIHNSYRRNGDGDYRCTLDQINAMVRDSEIKTQDMNIIECMTASVFNTDSLHSYRIKMSTVKPNNRLQNLSDKDFLQAIGAIKVGEDLLFHPTAAGLLMFGKSEFIKKEYPSYCLEYKETTQDDKHTIISSNLNSDCENLYDFFIKVFEKISYDIKLTANTKSDITPITTALQEALANCLINADYYGSNGVVVMKDDESITISNPGGFRVELDAARAGGISDPRNTAIMRMFNLIGIGSNDGFGISNIFSVWKSHGLVLPVIEESFKPENITLKLSFVLESKSTNTQILQNRPDIETDRQDAVISYITDNITVTSKEISELLGISHKKSKQLLHKIMAKDFVIIKNGKYTLKA